MLGKPWRTVRACLSKSSFSAWSATALIYNTTCSNYSSYATNLVRGIYASAPAPDEKPCGFSKLAGFEATLGISRWTKASAWSDSRFVTIVVLGCAA